MHTAVKIAPQYESIDHPVIHVLDASRSVVVVGNLLEKNADKRDDYVEDTLDLYDEMREDYYAGLEERNLLSFDQAIEKRLSIDWAKEPCAGKPVKPGVHVEKNYPLSEVVPYIDWNPFFQTWELRGRYPNRGFPKIFNDDKVGAEAKKLLRRCPGNVERDCGFKQSRVSRRTWHFPRQYYRHGRCGSIQQ